MRLDRRCGHGPRPDRGPAAAGGHGGDLSHTDDTPVTALDAQGGSFKGRLWTYLDPLGQQVVFDATATHERDGPEAFLAPFAGALQADAYAGYDALYRSGRVVEIGCWAHAGRRFVEALATDPQAALIVALIQQLYQVERASTDLDADARRARRRDQAVPLLARIDTVRQDLARTVLPKSPLGDAVRYLTNQWTALQRYVEDDRLAIDNNRAENQLRVVAVGRKTGCSPGVWREPAAPRSCIRWSRAANWSTSHRSTISGTSCSA